jgi:hypothetical protein
MRGIVKPTVTCRIGIAALILTTTPFQLLRSQNVEGSPGLNLVIVQGEGAINNIRQRTARETIVQVEDANHRPVAGAIVTFVLPGSGPGGTFVNGSKIMTAIANDQGRAVAAGLKPNSIVGQFQIRVTASHQGMSGSASVSQTNSAVGAAAGGAAGSGKLIAILAAVGGAVIGGVVIATKGDDEVVVPPIPSIVISTGSPSVGPPR